MNISNLERKTLPKDYKLSVYDGSYEDYAYQMKLRSEQEKKEKKDQEKMAAGEAGGDQNCSIF